MALPNRHILVPVSFWCPAATSRRDSGRGLTKHSGPSGQIPPASPLQGPERRDQGAKDKLALLVVFHCSRHPAVSRRSPS